MTKEPSIKFRLTVFPVLAIIFAIAAYFLVMLAIGYKFKYENGRLIKEKTGSIILSTRPGDAFVFIDGKQYRKKTSPFNIFTLNIDKLAVGNHQVRIEKEGFETWEGSFSVESGMVSWANKILMIATKRETSPYKFSGNVTQVIPSANKTRTLVVVENSEKNIREFWEVNTNSKEKRRVFAPTNLSEKVNFLKYSLDNERVIAEKEVAGVKKYLVYEMRENGRFWDLDNSVVGSKELAFNPRNTSEIFFLKGTDLFSYDYLQKRISNPLETSLINLFNQKNQIFYIKNNEGNYGLWRLEQNGSKTNLIKALPVSESYQMASLPELEAYSVLSLKDKTLLLYINRKGTPALEKIAENVDWFTESPYSKYLSYSKDGNIYSYEVEKNRYFQTLSNRKITNLTWFFDEFNLLFLEDEKLKLITVNGFYDKTLFDISGLPLVVSPNNSNIYFGQKNTLGNDLSTYSFDY